MVRFPLIEAVLFVYICFIKSDTSIDKTVGYTSILFFKIDFAEIEQVFLRLSRGKSLYVFLL